MQEQEYARMRQLEDHYWWFVARRELALRLLAPHLPPPAQKPHILDVGCGTGAVLAQLEPLGQAVGVDFSPAALEFSHQRGLPALLRADAQRLPLAPESFHAALALDTIEHVPDDQAAVRQIYQALKPGGVFVMNVPAFRWLWGPHDVALMHHRRYTRPQVKSLLTQAGFQIEKISYSVFFLFPVVVLRRLAEKTARGEPEVRLPQVSEKTNQSLLRLMRAEANLFQKTNLPFGSSVVALARKPR